MSSSAPRRQAVPEAQPFSYLDAGVAAGAVPTASSAGRAGAGESPAGSSNPGPSAEERNQQLQAAAFERGRQTAEQKLRAELEGAAAKNREAVARALREFAAERTGYYRRVEGEVVALALAIARKLGWQFDIMSTSFFLSRRALKPAAHSGMPRWQDHLFIALSRTANDATDYFQIPSGRVVEVGTQVTV